MSEALTIERVDIDTVEPHPENARVGDVDAIGESLEATGQYVPIVVQRSTGYIVKGNHTWKAAKRLGWTDIDVVYRDVDDARAKRILLADNRASDLGYYDEAALSALLQSFPSADDLLGTLYSESDVIAMASAMAPRTGPAGTLGDVGESPTPGERRDAYEANQVRAIILPLGAVQYEAVLADLAALRAEYEVETNAQVVIRLVDEAVGALGG